MGKFLYAVGLVAMALGAFLLYSSMRHAEQIDDVLMLLGAPVVMSGITLLLYGTLLVFLGRVLALMTQMARKTIWLDAWDGDGKVLIKCPKCAQQLRVAGGKAGSVNCPKCGNKFETQT
jgi:hypothetical protein